MEAFRLLRERSIERLGDTEHDAFANTAIALWERMASEITALVGEAGFDSLYARSVFLVLPTFPWLSESKDLTDRAQRFASLRTNLEENPPELAREANRVLLVIFTDTLASLIGAPLTARVLSSAWSDFAQCGTNKEEK